MQVSTIGVDLAKNVFQVHGVDSVGNVVITRQLRRKQIIEFFGKIPACLVGMEACGTAHHWAREVSKLGHTVRLMPPSYVKGYVKRSKNDAADAAAICEAVTRPSMRFVPIKSADQQALLMLHRTRDLLIRQRTQLINALRAHLAEFGLVAETGREGLAQLAEIVTDESNREALPSAMKQALQAIIDQLAALELQIGSLDRAIHAHHRANDTSCAPRRTRPHMTPSGRAEITRSPRRRWNLSGRVRVCTRRIDVVQASFNTEIASVALVRARLVVTIMPDSFWRSQK